MKETLNLYICDKNNMLPSSESITRRKLNESKAAQKNTATNNGLVVRGFPAPLPNCQCFVGHAIVSVLIRPVSTPSLRSVGHSPHVHGTQAQFYMATSPSLDVVRNVCLPQDKDGAQDQSPKKEMHYNSKERSNNGN
jgi:hypothetical protein